MDYIKQFAIPFSGLSLGIHQFEYEIGDKFFECIEYSEVKHGTLDVLINLDKQERMLEFTIKIRGTVEVDCDRCGDPYNQAVSCDELLIVKFGDTFHEEGDEILVIPRNEHKIDLAHYLYEYIMLSLPFQKIHPADENGNSTCNPEQIRKLEELSPKTEPDPRWDQLKGLNLPEN